MAKRARPKLEVLRTVKDAFCLAAGKRDILALYFVLALMTGALQLSQIYFTTDSVAFIAAYIVLIAFIAIVGVALTKSSYNSMRGRRLELSKNLAATIGLLPRLIGLGLVFALAITPVYIVMGIVAFFSEQMSAYAALSAILFFLVYFVAAAYAFMRLALSQLSIIIGGMGVARSLRFSWEKTRGSVLRMMATYIVIGIAMYAVMLVVAFVLGLVFGAFFVLSGEAASASSALILACMAVLMVAMETLFIPTYTFASLIIYEKLRK